MIPKDKVEFKSMNELSTISNNSFSKKFSLIYLFTLVNESPNSNPIFSVVNFGPSWSEV